MTLSGLNSLVAPPPTAVVQEHESIRSGRNAFWVFAAAFAVRLIVAVAARAFSDPLNNYDYVVTPTGHLVFQNPGFLPPGGFYVEWVLFVAGGRTLAGFGIIFVALGSLIPLLVVRLS